MTTAVQQGATLTIGEVAERTGLSVHALRYYERQDLLIGPVQRTSGGRRTTPPWMSTGSGSVSGSASPACRSRTWPGSPPLSDRRAGNEEDRLRLLDEHRQRIEAQIQALEECRSLIEWKVGVYTEHLRAGSATGLWDPRNGA